MFVLFGYLFICFIFGTTYFAIKVGLQGGIPPMLFAGIRFLLAGGITLFFLLIQRKTCKLTWKQTKGIFLSGFLMTTIPFGALFWAEQYISSGMAAILVASAPVFTALLGMLTKEMEFRWLLVPGFILSFLGTVFIVGFEQSSVVSEGLTSLLAKISIIVAELFFGIGVIHSRKILAQIPPLAFNGYQSLYASVSLLLLSFVFEQERYTSILINSTNLVAVLYLAIIASILASTIYYWLVKQTNSTFPTTWTYIAPIIAMVIGSMYLDEQVTWIQVVGSTSILLGIVMINWGTLGKLFRFKRKINHSTAV